MAATVKKEPFVRIVKRADIKASRAWLIRGYAILVSVLLAGIFVFLVTGTSPIDIYKYMFTGTFGTAKRILKTIKLICPYLCLGVALAPAFKMRFWNIGAEGQLLIGGLAATALAVYMPPSTPSAVLLLLMLLSSIVAGAIWGLIPAIFKAVWNTNETLFTLMMNYIALDLVLFFTNIWKGMNTEFGHITENAWLPPILGQDFGICVIIVALLSIMMHFYMTKSKHGYEISVVGASENTARYAGISVPKVIIRTVAISAAICGICGFFVVSGIDHTISSGTAGGRGFDAIIVAWLAKFNVGYMVMTSFLLVFLDNAATEIATYCRINTTIADVIAGIILFFILGSEFFINYKLLFRAKASKN